MNSHQQQSPFRLTLTKTGIFAVIFLDQFSKYLVRTNMMIGDHLSCCAGILQLIRIENHDGFLSLFSQFDETLRFVFLTVFVSFLLLAGSWYLVWRTHDLWSTLLLSAVIGGGASNLLDRIFNNGGVTDFLLIQLRSLHTGIFNLADVFILIGATLYGYRFFSRPASSRSNLP